jgi:hypothetical protein
MQIKKGEGYDQVINRLRDWVTDNHVFVIRLNEEGKERSLLVPCYAFEQMRGEIKASTAERRFRELRKAFLKECPSEFTSGGYESVVYREKRWYKIYQDFLEWMYEIQSEKI